MSDGVAGEKGKKRVLINGVDLMGFCSRDEMQLAEPFTHDGYDFYSDGVMILKVVAGGRVTAKPPIEAFYGLPWRQPGDNDNLWFQAEKVPILKERCECCLGSGRVDVCADCGGSGEVLVVSPCKYFSECGRCHGHGVVVGDSLICEDCCGSGMRAVDGEGVISVKGNAMIKGTLAKVQVLPDVSIYSVPVVENMLFFRFDGGCGLVMMARVD